MLENTSFKNRFFFFPHKLRASVYLEQNHGLSYYVVYVIYN